MAAYHPISDGIGSHIDYEPDAVPDGIDLFRTYGQAKRVLLSWLDNEVWAIRDTQREIRQQRVADVRG